MKKKILISICLMNLIFVIGFSVCLNVFNDSIGSFEKNAVFVSLQDQSRMGQEEKRDFAFTKEQMEEIKNIPGVQSTDFISSRTGDLEYIENQPEEFTIFNGKYASELDKAYTQLTYSQGHAITKDSEVVISESKARHIPGNPIGKKLNVPGDPNDKLTVVGVYKNNKLNPKGSDSQFYAKNLPYYEYSLDKESNQNYGITNELNSYLEKNYSREELVNIYGMNLKKGVYVKLDGKTSIKEFEKNTDKIVKGATYYSNEYTIDQSTYATIYMCLALANLFGIILIVKLKHQEKVVK